VLRTIRVTRYVTPLREGGSLPALVEGHDEGTYVLKFRGAGQGPKALIAELVGGEIGRLLGLPVPELVFADLHEDMARTEPDPEIFALIRGSAGRNLALDYLPGSIMFNPLVDDVDSELASKIVWFDAFVTNMDRTARNTNLLMWHKRLWLIDHGASLYAQHTPGWAASDDKARDPFRLIASHVLLARATGLHDVDAEMAAALTPTALERITGMIPEDWLGAGETPADYHRYLLARVATPRAFVDEAVRAREEAARVR
jgi:hypothetical protein